jgi:hypothetical protein
MTVFAPIERLAARPVSNVRLPLVRRAAVAAVALLLAVRLAVPPLIVAYANRTLDRIPGFDGRIESVSLNLVRGAYAIRGVEVVKTGGAAPVPFFRAERVEFSVQWSQLLRGAWVGDVRLVAPQLNVVAGDGKTRQTDIHPSWQQRADELFPLRINRLDVEQGNAHFRNYEARPPVDVRLEGVTATVSNLANTRGAAGRRQARVVASARVMGRGNAGLRMDLEPLAERPTFNMRLHLRLFLPELNAFLRHYLAVEASDGRLDLYLEGRARDGAFSGYVKPLARDLDMLRIKPDASLAEKVKGAVVEAVAAMFENKPQEQLGTKVDVSGRFDEPDIGLLEAAGRFLGNAFTAIRPGFEGAAHPR